MSQECNVMNSATWVLVRHMPSIARHSVRMSVGGQRQPAAYNAKQMEATADGTLLEMCMIWSTMMQIRSTMMHS